MLTILPRCSSAITNCALAPCLSPTWRIEITVQSQESLCCLNHEANCFSSSRSALLCTPPQYPLHLVPIRSRCALAVFSAQQVTHHLSVDPILLIVSNVPLNRPQFAVFPYMHLPLAVSTPLFDPLAPQVPRLFDLLALVVVSDIRPRSCIVRLHVCASRNCS